MQEKVFVTSLYNEKAKNDSNSQDLANSLNILSKTVFGEVNRFIFELLQNADDAPKSTAKCLIDVEFRLLKNHLIFCHTGSHFSNEDVKGISRVGNRENKKSRDIKKTGYKGIGFKSVFGTSNFVQIISNDFSFRFDKNYPLWRDRKDYPWQVIPIWTEGCPTEVTRYLNKDYVNTIIQIPNRERIKSEIEKVFDDCQILLFLRHIGQIHFFDNDNLVFSIEKRESKNNIRHLYKSGKLLSSWIIKDFFVSVDQKLQTKLSKLSDEECPPKLKEAKNTKITFAGYVENDRILQVEDALMYCYLPTKVNKNFPFIINADFITNAERTQFLDNSWNEFLFEEIAYLQFEWFRELQTTSLRFQVAALIKNKFRSRSWDISTIEKSFNHGFDLGVNEVEFLPQKDINSLLTARNSIIDTTGFSEKFGTKIISDFLENRSGIVDLRIEYPEILISSLGVTKFGIEELCSLFLSSQFPMNGGLTPQNNIKLLQFFFNKTSDNKNSNWLSLLKKTKFLLNNSNELNTPSEIFFPGVVQAQVSQIVNLNLLNLSVFHFCQHNLNIFKWLNDLGVKEPSNLEVLRKSIFKIIIKGEVNEHNAIRIGRFIFNVFRGGQLTDKDYQNISSIKLLTQNGLKLPHETYLPDKYDPELKIGTILSDANFVLVDYPEESSQFEEWKSFLLRIGVKENISISVDTSITSRASFISKHNYTEPYFQWLDREEHYASIYRPYKYQHSISNFAFITFFQHLSVHSFSKVFWKLIMNSWNTLLEKCSKTKYHYRGGSTIVPSFFQYYISANPTIPATDGKCYKSESVYIPSLKNVIGDFFPVADFDNYVTKEQADFLGFKRKIPIGDCLTILKQLEKHPINSDLNKQVFAIYDQMIKKKNDLDSSLLAAIQNWKKNGKLLAQNNTFQRASDLYCFAMRELIPPVDSENFIKMPNYFKFEDLKSFCQIFEIPIVTYNQLSFVPEEEIIEEELHQELKTKLKYLSIVYAHEASEDQLKVFYNLSKKISETIFYSAKKLSLVYSNNDLEEIYSSNIQAWYDKNSLFYYVGKWDSPLTLYSLSGSLCTYFKMKGLERELALFLQLNENAIYTWLCEKGYVVKDELLNEIPIYESEIELTENEVKEQEEEYIGTLVAEDFKPEVKAKDVDVSIVRVSTKEANKIRLNPNPIDNKIQSSPVRMDIGKWSEEFIYKYLKESNEFSEIIWENENGESGKPYDFLITSNGMTKYIEVKGTPSSTKEIIYLSQNEWKLMFNQSENYSIYRLYNAGTKNPNIEVFNNPAKLIKEGIILPNPIALQV